MKRLDQFRVLLKETGADGFFTSSVSNITYLSGFTGDSSRLLVSGDRAILITDGRYTEQAEKECFPNVEVFKWLENKRYDSLTYNFLFSELKIGHLAIEGNILTLAEYETLKQTESLILTSVSSLVEKLRKQKEPEEIEWLKTACSISDKALQQTLPFIREGTTELELVARLDFHLKMNGANLSFDTMVLSGARTSLLHGKPGNYKLRRGDAVLFDFGALFNGYHADISRAFFIGEPSTGMREIYQIIQSAQETAVLAAKAGATSHELDKLVRNCIPEKYQEYYYPGLGHGVGLEIHEAPFVGTNYVTTLEENMVITIEPGIYIPGLGGIRIEDTVWINKSGAESLTSFSRDLMIL